MRGLVKLLVFLALVVGAAAVPTVRVMDKTMAKDVLVILNPYSEPQVKQNRMLRHPDDPVAEIYGTPTKEKVRVIFYDQARLLTPVEDNTQTYYLVHDASKDQPTQVKRYHFLADRAMKFGLGAGILGLLVLLFVWKDREK